MDGNHTKKVENPENTPAYYCVGASNENLIPFLLCARVGQELLEEDVVED